MKKDVLYILGGMAILISIISILLSMKDQLDELEDSVSELKDTPKTLQLNTVYNIASIQGGNNLLGNDGSMKSLS